MFALFMDMTINIPLYLDVIHWNEELSSWTNRLQMFTF